MILSENRFPPIGSWPEGMLFRIMLQFSNAAGGCSSFSANLAPRAAKIKRQNR
jgi:hypothetical protein